MAQKKLPYFLDQPARAGDIYFQVFHQIVAYLPYNATELVRFLKIFKLCFFFSKKIDGFFLEKCLIFFQNRLRCQICRRIRIKWFCFKKMSLRP